MSKEQPQMEEKRKTWGSLIFLCISALFSQACVYVYYGYLTLDGLKLGAPTSIATLLPMAASIPPIFLLIVFGIFADRSGRRKQLVLVGLAFAAIFNVLMALSSGWIELLIFRIIGAGIYATVMWLYAVLFIFQLPPERRGLGIGLFVGVSTFGTFIFQLFSGSWAAAYGYAFLYYVGAVLSALALIFLIPVRVPIVKSGAGTSGKEIMRAITNRGVYYPGIVWAVSMFGYSALVGVLPIILITLGGSIALIGVLFAINTLFCATGSFVGGPIIDKLGPKTILVVAGIIAGAIVLAIPSFGSYIGVAAVVWAVSFVFFVTYPAPAHNSTACCPPELAGTAVNTVTTLFSIGAVLGGYLAGTMLSTYGWHSAIYIMGIIMVASGVIALGLPRIKKPAKP